MATSVNAAGAASQPATAAPAPQASPVVPPDGIPFDVTAESAPDSAESFSQAAIRRAELFMVAAHMRDQEQQMRLDRMRADFDNAQARRAELLREANALREMALAQAKADDEVLKKIIGWI